MPSGGSLSGSGSGHCPYTLLSPGIVKDWGVGRGAAEPHCLSCCPGHQGWLVRVSLTVCPKEAASGERAPGEQRLKGAAGQGLSCPHGLVGLSWMKC